MSRMVLLVVASAVIAGCATGASGDSTRSTAGTTTISGHVVVIDGGEWAKGCDPYYSSRGHSDIRRGARVVIENAAGAVIATGTVGAVTRDPAVLGRCVFAFSVPKVPMSAFYKIAVAGATPVVTSRTDVVSGAVNIEVP